MKEHENHPLEFFSLLYSNQSVAILEELSRLNPVSSSILVKDPVAIGCMIAHRYSVFASYHAIFCRLCFFSLFFHLFYSDLCLLLLVGSVDDYAWSTNHAFLEEITASFCFSSNKEKKIPDSRVLKRQVKVTPGIEIPCLNISMFLSFQKGHICSRASQKGWTSRLLYQMRKSWKVCMLLPDQTCWQYW